ARRKRAKPLHDQGLPMQAPDPRHRAASRLTAWGSTVTRRGHVPGQATSSEGAASEVPGKA
ncbi:hypothetical protein, partial [Roseomonas sp. KE2513]|uniref:hypothetical protein n=1 Tax=Roseomonas sp. KE2513 TaxID=2479202 RepID=UPI001E460E34